MAISKISDFKIIDASFIVREEEAPEVLESAKEFADSEIGLYSLEARARKISNEEMAKYNLSENHSLIELSIVVWEGYSNDDLEEARHWIHKKADSVEIAGIELKTRDMLQDEFEAFQACAPEYFEEAQG